MEDLSEQMIRTHCPHCAEGSFAFKFLLSQSQHFKVLCDVHPLMEGHLLIIPKRHVACAGEYTPEEWEDFNKIYPYVTQWVYKKFGSVATFEHGKIGQTVFHSHIHVLPFKGSADEIVPEGNHYYRPLESLKELCRIFQEEGQYLFFSIDQSKWAVDTCLGKPRFFRDRFANALGCPERADWKATAKNPELQEIGREENERCRNKFLEDFQQISLFKSQS